LPLPAQRFPLQVVAGSFIYRVMGFSFFLSSFSWLMMAVARLFSKVVDVFFFLLAALLFAAPW